MRHGPQDLVQIDYIEIAPETNCDKYILKGCAGSFLVQVALYFPPPDAIDVTISLVDSCTGFEVFEYFISKEPTTIQMTRIVYCLSCYASKTA